jgi:acetyltransferase-like isoleucine patch superfamily enzyme
MKFANINLGADVEIETSSTLNNVQIGDNVKIAKRCSIFGAPDKLLEIGNDSYVGMNCTINGYMAKVKIGKNVSVAQNVHIMSDSGPNASLELQKVFPIIVGPVLVGDNCWIGANAIIMPNVSLGEYCVVAANSFVNKSFSSYSVIGGNPVRLIRVLSNEEIDKIKEL